MNALLLNITVGDRLRRSASIWLGVLPITLMFSSFLVLWPFATWSSAALGLPEGAPVMDQTNGLIWLALFLTVMVALMICGYVLGWVLNGLICLAAFRWPRDKVQRVFLESDVPAEWLKAEGAAAKDAARAKPKWDEIRAKGRWHFVFTRGIMAWGIPMYTVMGVVPGVRAHMAALYFLWQGLVWAAAGALFGLAIWYFAERSYLANARKEP